MDLKLYILVLLCSVLKCTLSSSLETVSDTEFLNLVKTEKYVIVLFTRKDCEECDNLENEVISLREDLVDMLGAWVVRVVNSPLVKLYNPAKEPALVFFRHGIAMLYDGPVNDEAILNTLIQNKEPAVKELSDDTFEHLTQAATGATTGDWLVMFYRSDCVECQRLQARFEAVGGKLRGRVNVAQVNKQTIGAATARRFGVRDVPSFIFFRLGKMYRYDVGKIDPASLTAFALDWYKNVKAEPVPVPKTPFDDFTEMVAEYLRENPLVWKIAAGFVALLILLKVASAAFAKPKPAKKEAKKKK